MKVKFNNETHELPLFTSLASLKEAVENLTKIPAANQKLIYKGKQISTNESFASLPPNALLMLVGLHSSDLEDIQSTNEKRLASFTLPIGKAYVSKPSSSPYSFSRLESLTEFHDSESAISYLARLRDDKGKKRYKLTFRNRCDNEKEDLLGRGVEGAPSTTRCFYFRLQPEQGCCNRSKIANR
jgi:hypothetical protein